MLFSDSKHHSSIHLSRKDRLKTSRKSASKFVLGKLGNAAKAVSRIQLSRADLLEISLAVSRDFSPVFTTAISGGTGRIKLSSRELLEISETISLAYQPRIGKTAGVILLPVDPEHLYVYWHQPETVSSQAKDGSQATLRIYAQTPGSQLENQQMPAWFDVDIQTPAHQQTLAIPARSDDMVYSAQIGTRDADDRFVAVGNSNSIRVPRQDIGIGQAEEMQDLSGLAALLARPVNASGQR